MNFVVLTSKFTITPNIGDLTKFKVSAFRFFIVILLKKIHRDLDLMTYKNEDKITFSLIGNPCGPIFTFSFVGTKCIV